MAVTVTFDFATITPEFIGEYSKNVATTADLGGPALTALADGGFAVAQEWDLSPNNQILLERYTIDGSARLPISVIDAAPFTANKGSLSVAQLTTGGIITTWTADTTGIRYSITDPVTGNVTTPDTLVPSTSSLSDDSDVTALQGGGFAIVNQHDVSAADKDADLRIFSAAGVLVTTKALGNNSSSDERAPSVATLNNGNVVVAYEKELTDNGGDFGMAIEIYTSAGVAVLGQTIFDAIGNSNRRPDVVALNDGGFAVGYEDNGYGEQGVTVAFFNQAGLLLGVTRADNSFFSDDDVQLSTLANGYVVASWTDNGVDIQAAVIDPVTRARVGGPHIIEDQNGQQERSSVAGLANGTFITAWHDYNTAIADGNTDDTGSHVSMQIEAFRRITTGDSLANSITGDGLIDIVNAGDGADIVFGNGGSDRLNGGLGADRIDGGAYGDAALNGDGGNDLITGGDGDDTANGGSEDDIIYGQAGRDTLRGGAGTDTLYGGDEAGAGDVLLAGEAGADHVQGGLGNDRIDGGTENDKLFGEGGGDVITGGQGNDRLEGGVDADVLQGNEDNDYLLGGAGIDTLYGGAGIDYLYGDADNDFLQGDGGNDNLYGGAGLDRFNFDLANGSDAIFDFTNDQDTLIIDPLFGFATAAAVVAATIQTGNHARILLPGADTDIYLWNYLTPGNGNTIGNLIDDITIA